MSEHTAPDESDYRERIYDAFADAEHDGEKALQDALDTGRRRLDADVGFLTHIEDGVQTITHVVGDDQTLREAERRPTVLSR